MAFTILLSVALGGILVAFYIYRRFYVSKIFAKEGIPGPKPHWLTGNATAFVDENERHLVIPKWTKTYGKLYGYFEGSTPVLVTSDVDIVTQIFVKQADVFHGRKLVPLQPDPESVTDSRSHMLFARGERWKRLRTVVNPTFSAGKLRSLTPLMAECQHDFIELIDQKVKTSGSSKDGINVFECFQLLTLDTISETAFGVKMNSLKSGNSGDGPLLKTLKKAFQILASPTPSMILVTVIPEISRIVDFIEYYRAALFNSGFLQTILDLDRLMTQVVKERKLNPQLKRPDLMQMMLDLEVPTGAVGNQKGLAPEEIVAQSVMFMVAGYETSSNALAFTAFLLANNPKIQDKLISEIDSYYDDGKKAVDYDSVNELKYLDCVVLEALRLFPVAPLVVTRMAMRDTEVNGVRISKGMCILADVWAIHHDEAEWGPVDTEAFHPERFQEDYPTKATRRDSSFLAFGFGPRICIGLRFAMLEIKLTLVNLLRKYRIEKTPRTGDNLKLAGGLSITPAEGVWVKLVERP